MLGTTAHVAALGYYLWLLHFVMELRPDGRGDPSVLQQYIDFRPKYLSVWALVSQVVVLALSVAVDATRLLTAPPSSTTSHAAKCTERLRDLVFVSVAAPLALTGSAMYAGLCMVDRGLVMPAALDAALPPWLNQAMHTVPTLQVVLQLFAERMAAPRTTSALKLSFAVTTAYSVTMFIEYLNTGRWLYPVLAVLDWPGRMALNVFTTGFLLAQVPLLGAAIRLRWSSSMENGKDK